jgi:hypothetical protein
VQGSGRGRGETRDSRIKGIRAFFNAGNITRLRRLFRSIGVPVELGNINPAVGLPQRSLDGSSFVFSAGIIHTSYWLAAVFGVFRCELQTLWCNAERLAGVVFPEQAADFSPPQAR